MRIGAVVNSKDVRRKRGQVVDVSSDLDRAVVEWPDGDQTCLSLRHLSVIADDGLALDNLTARPNAPVNGEYFSLGTAEV